MKAEERTVVRQDSRRTFARHRIPFPLVLRDGRVSTPLRVNATDISGNGCYVETVMPLSVGTALRVDLWMGEERVTLDAVVRNRGPGFGKGIEFNGLPEESKRKFQAQLEELDRGIVLGPNDDQ